MKTIECMRWFGPLDVVSLSDIRQAGCSGVVTALHHIPVGDVWSAEEIEQRKTMIEAAGMQWSVVESLPVHEDIKKRNGNYLQWIENYKVSLQNLSAFGIKVITYNFMPVLDWVRTNLNYITPAGGRTLRFEKLAFIAFDLFILCRPAAEKDYSGKEIEKAKVHFQLMPEEEKAMLKRTCLQALPGSTESFTSRQVLALLDEYGGISREQLQNHLILFLKEITPLADELGMQLAIHPDDPPYQVLGLPRIMNTEADARFILEAVPNRSNGICFCSGSFGARPDNDLAGMVKRLGYRIYFLHLRSTHRDMDGNFHEANHLEGDANMFDIMKEVVNLMHQEQRSIPLRPDHGHELMDDYGKLHYPGYSAIGRLKALGELRGLEMGISRTLI